MPLVHPTLGRIRFEPYHYQARLLADRSARRLVLKARQTGVSQTLAIETAHGAIYQPDTTTLWLSKDQASAAQVLGYVKTVLYGLGVALAKDAETSVRLANGSRVISLPASPASGRSYAATRVYLDEFAHVHYHQHLYTAVAPTVSHGGQLTVISTPNGRANTFFLLWSGQLGSEWSRHTIHWRDCPVYDAAWYAASRPDFTAQQWAQEYECDFVMSGTTRFQPADIERAHDEAWGCQPAAEDRQYLTAGDIGRRKDATVGVTLTMTPPYQVVAFERLDGVSYPRIQQAIEARTRAYPGQTFVESNGVGDPVIENLTVPVEPWVTTARSKVQALDALTLLLEQGEVKWRDIPVLDAELLVYQDDDRGLVQDCVMALAIAAVNVRRYGGSLFAWGDLDEAQDDWDA